MSISPSYDNNKKPVTGTFKDATPLLDKPEELKQLAEEDGLLFFKGLIPREDILQVRSDVLEVLDTYGLLDKVCERLEGKADLDAVHQYPIEELSWHGVGITYDMYRDIQRLESFHALAHHTQVLLMLKKLFGCEAFPHPRNIGRFMLPHRDAKDTPSHQDYLHVQGEEETWTCWIPLGDTPRSLGGLSVLKGSHKAGLLGVTNAPGAGGLETILCGLDYEWQTVDFSAGDVLAFNSLTVHKSMPNQLQGKIRISCDFRYQAIKPTIVIEKGSLLPHGTYTWEELYEGWENKQYQYYWNKLNFDFTPYDESIKWQKDKIC